MNDKEEHYFMPPWMHATPMRVTYNGALWVATFFILSGFVLPLGFFKSNRP